MSQPFMAEVRMVGFNFAPRGWAFCDGQVLSISQNQSLFSLLGTTFGGDGRSTFALPDLRGRAPLHAGKSTTGTDYPLGAKSGQETHTLTSAEMPQHNHNVEGTDDAATSSAPAGDVLAQTPAAVGSIYSTSGSADANLAPAAVANTGGGQPHDNMQPFLVVNFCIALQGLFPSRS